MQAWPQGENLIVTSCVIFIYLSIQNIYCTLWLMLRMFNSNTAIYVTLSCSRQGGKINDSIERVLYYLIEKWLSWTCHFVLILSVYSDWKKRYNFSQYRFFASKFRKIGISRLSAKGISLYCLYFINIFFLLKQRVYWSFVKILS